MPACADPEKEAQRRQRLAEATRRQWQDPEVRARRVAGLRAALADPEAKARKSRASKAQWQDPATRQKHVDSLSEAHADGRMGDYSWFKGLSGPKTSQWRGDEAKYRAAHVRVETARGKAVEHVCVDCGNQAEEWSFINGTGFSLDVADYSPRCCSCHRLYDRRDATA